MRVNAQVVGGVSALIEALSSFPAVRTLESCEGSGDSAWVCFDCGEQNWKALAEFVFGVLGPPLIAEFGDHINVSVGITGSGMYRAEMIVKKASIPALSHTVKHLVQHSRAA